MTGLQLRRLLRRRLPELLAAGAAVAVLDGDKVVFRAVVDRAFRLEPGGKQASLALWFRPLGEPEWDPRIRARAYPIERARCLLIDRATETRDGLSLDGPTGRALIKALEAETEVEHVSGWIEYREVWLTPQDEAALDELRA